MKRYSSLFIPALALLATHSFSYAHDERYEHVHADSTEVRELPHVPEKSGPVDITPPSGGTREVSGQGFWRFRAVPDVLPIPAEAAGHVPRAHGTLVVDADADIVYWGLENVGWIAYSERLSRGAVISGDPRFAKGNLHGADLYARPGAAPLIAVADNVSGEVYLSDTAFERAEVLSWPEGGPYSAKGEYKPTDVAFVDEATLYITDGYGKAFFMRAATEPLEYEGPFIGGKEMSKTPHGVTFRSEDQTLLLSARPEGEIKRMKLRDQEWLETFGLPAGSTVCDVEIWGDYALAPCLKGPDGAPGPIYILNLNERTIASIIKPREELGFTDAEHIHDATWYFSGDENAPEVYILFTNWNPGGIGALQLVGAED